MKKAISNSTIFFTLILLISALPSCKKASQSQASVANLNGTWTGTAMPTGSNPYNYQAGTISMALTESGSDVTGTFTFTQNAVGGTGSVSGHISGTNVDLTLTMTYPTNPRSLNYTINLGETINSTYTTLSGTFNVYDGGGLFYYEGLFLANKQQ